MPNIVEAMLKTFYTVAPSGYGELKEKIQEREMSVSMRFSTGIIPGPFAEPQPAHP